MNFSWVHIGTLSRFMMIWGLHTFCTWFIYSCCFFVHLPCIELHDFDSFIGGCILLVLVILLCCFVDDTHNLVYSEPLALFGSIIYSVPPTLGHVWLSRDMLQGSRPGLSTMLPVPIKNRIITVANLLLWTSTKFTKWIYHSIVQKVIKLLSY